MYLADGKSIGCLIFLAMLTACANTGGYSSGKQSKSGQCTAFDTNRYETGYSARLVTRDDLGEGIVYEVQIQAVHAKSMASRIERITYTDQSIATFEFVSDSCVCGMRVKNADVECTHITNYIARVSTGTLQRSLENGLAMTFSLENGRIVAGPHIKAGEIEKVLLR
ncbi:MAG: hypothetical protein AAFX54_00925 [Pseudomonadota bacterium]